MAQESITNLKEENITYNLPFEIVAVPQYDDLHSVNSTDNTSPINVKIRIRNKEDISNKYGIISKLAAYNSGKKVRLVNSDQTIMSFDFFTEVDTSKRNQKKFQKNIFHIFKRGPSKMKKSTPIEHEQNSIIQEINPLQKNIPSSSNTDTTARLPRLFMGKCKPGGCLDPPFNEDYYTFKPAKERSISHAINMTTNSVDQKISKRKEENITKDLIISYKENNNIDTLITYPSTSSSCEKRSKDSNDVKSKSRISSEDKARISVSEFSEIFFMPPRKDKTKSEKNINGNALKTYDITKYESLETVNFKPNKDKASSEQNNNILRTPLESKSFADKYDETYNENKKNDIQRVMKCEIPAESKIFSQIITVPNIDKKLPGHIIPENTNELNTLDPLKILPTESKINGIDKDCIKAIGTSIRKKSDEEGRYTESQEKIKEINFAKISDSYQIITQTYQALERNNSVKSTRTNNISDNILIQNDSSNKMIEANVTEHFNKKSQISLDASVIDTIDLSSIKEINHFVRKSQTKILQTKVDDDIAESTTVRHEKQKTNLLKETENLLKPKTDDISSSKEKRNCNYDQLSEVNEIKHSLNRLQNINEDKITESNSLTNNEQLISVEHKNSKLSLNLFKTKTNEVVLNQSLTEAKINEIFELDTLINNAQFISLENNISFKEPFVSEKIIDDNIVKVNVSLVESNTVLTEESSSTRLHNSMESRDEQKIFETSKKKEIPEKTSVSSKDCSGTSDKSIKLESNGTEINKYTTRINDDDDLLINKIEKSFGINSENRYNVNKFEQTRKRGSGAKINTKINHEKSIDADMLKSLSGSHKDELEKKDEYDSVYKRNFTKLMSTDPLVLESKQLQNLNKIIEGKTSPNNLNPILITNLTTSKSSMPLLTSNQDGIPLSHKTLKLEEEILLPSELRNQFHNFSVDNTVAPTNNNLMSKLIKKSFDNQSWNPILRTSSEIIRKITLIDDFEIITKNVKDIEENIHNPDFSHSDANTENMTVNAIDNSTVTKSSFEDSKTRAFSTIAIDFKFKSFIDEDNTLIITTIDTTEPPDSQHGKISVIKSLIRENDDEIRIPIDLDIDLTMQIRRFKENSDFTDGERKTNENAKELTQHKDYLLQETLNSLYESLIPLESIIKGLKEEANLLSQQQTSFKNILYKIENKPIRLIKTDPNCGCNKEHTDV